MIRHIDISLCSSQDIVTRHLAEKSAAEDQMPPLGPVVWTAGSQSELTPSESLATSDAVRDTLLLPRQLSALMSFVLKLLPALKSLCQTLQTSFHCSVLTCFLVYILIHFGLVSQPRLLSSFAALSFVILPCLSLFHGFNVPSPHLHCL